MIETLKKHTFVVECFFYSCGFCFMHHLFMFGFHEFPTLRVLSSALYVEDLFGKIYFHLTI